MNALLMFEVMDKEPTLAAIWLVCMIIAVGGLFLARLHPILLVLPLFIAFMYGWMLHSEITDPFVGPDILREAGYSYVVGTYLAIVVALVAPFSGVVWWFRRRKPQK